ncbi:MAG: glycosyltransferase family 2 protein [Actinomycetota bacterium]|nr:glycosyltransferase family 2 protein [Actinomycetota bacterium]
MTRRWPERLFWAATATVVYTYVLFPLLLFLRAWVRPRPHTSADMTPTVSIVIAARNEAETIGAKLGNLLALDYPRDRLEIVIASDGSTDGTEDIVGAHEDSRIRLLALPTSGKAVALNEAVAASTGEIVVFSDANSMYERDAIRMLVRPFADPSVGGVAGNQRYAAPVGLGGSAIGERNYWSFDRALKVAESRAGNVVSATGAIYAVRRALFRGVPPGVTDDFVTSTAVIAQGRRLVFEPNAVAYEPTGASSDAEFARKVRIMTRGLRAVWTMRELLDPRRHGFYALQLASHKLLRRLMAAPLVVIAATGAMLSRRGGFYRRATIAQAVLYGFAAIGLLFEETTLGRKKIFALPAFFALVNAASIRAVWNVARGRVIDRWEPSRERPAKDVSC